ncbi:hypothetical protein GCM10009864_79980 [Streptomyces lunalinharesii]|uniref:Cyclodipeptide synthase n=1 Tax=Streptomyces lunalinharesii TaxID=333384 RepID=A0ABP6FL79_9ACTN
METLVDWACTHFKTVDVVVPGYEAAHTLTAAGVKVPEAVHRTRRALSRLRVPARRALSRAGYRHSEQHVHTWTQLANRAPYTASRMRAETAYRDGSALRRAVRHTARSAIQHAAGGQEPTEQQIDQAVDYVLAELPLVTDAPVVFNTKTSVFVYHRRIDIIEPLLSGEASSLRPADGQGCAVVTVNRVRHVISPRVHAGQGARWCRVGYAPQASEVLRRHGPLHAPDRSHREVFS